MAAGAGARDGLLVTLWIISIIIVTLTAINIDDTQDNFGFYWRGSIALVTTGALGIIVFPLLSFTIRFGKASGGAIGAEIVTLFILWCMLLGSCATLAIQWPSSFYCNRFRSYCRTYRAAQAWGWIAFGLILIVIIIDCIGGFSSKKETLPTGQKRSVDNVGTTSTDPLHSTKAQEGYPQQQAYPQQQPAATMA